MAESRTLHYTHIRFLTYTQRATWDTCPVCGATHGEPCKVVRAERQSGAAEDIPTPGAAHYARLMSAPLCVYE